jgi:hypothetical protein
MQLLTNSDIKTGETPASDLRHDSSLKAHLFDMSYLGCKKALDGIDWDTAVTGTGNESVSALSSPNRCYTDPIDTSPNAPEKSLSCNCKKSRCLKRPLDFFFLTHQSTPSSFALAME